MRVSCTVEALPSYLGHILSTARVGFESEYSDKYAHTINQRDASWLKENEDLFKWGNGKSGPLTGYGLFLLGYVNPESPDGIETYFNGLLNMAEDGNTSCLFENFPSLERLQEIWGPLNRPEAVEMLRALSKAIEHLKNILVENWDGFQTEVWPIEKPKVIRKADSINTQLQNLDLIENWENATGFTFQSEIYQYVLSSGMNNAPKFNTLGYGRNWVYYDIPFLLEGIVHEIGSHLLMQLLGELHTEYDHDAFYRVFETCCSFLTKLIFSNLRINTTPVEESKLYLPQANELFKERINSLPVQDLRAVIINVLEDLTASK